jgi:hypothetical protein
MAERNNVAAVVRAGKILERYSSGKKVVVLLRPGGLLV